MPRSKPEPWTDPYRLAPDLAKALAAGTWHAEDLSARAAIALGVRKPWLNALADRLASAFASGPRPTAAKVAAWLLNDRGFQVACRRYELKVQYLGWPRPAMSPVAAAWSVPAIVTTGELAALLNLTPGQLAAFADLQGRSLRNPDGPLQNYRYHWMSKRGGSARLIEAPKPRLKAIQRRLLDELIVKIPPHAAAHGFRTGRSVQSYVAPHLGRRVVLKLDLRDFFATITLPRVAAVFRTAGYPEPVARALAGLCTNQAPTSIWNDPTCPVRGYSQDAWRTQRLYRAPHLPQGAPTSPALANLCAYRLDLRLDALANSAQACYTRYADDLAFSGDRDFERSISRFGTRALAVALEEGFAIQPRKTRVMRRSVRQRVAGVVVNERPNVARPDYDRLKAVLHNCVKLGPHDQNRGAVTDFRAHLAGRVAYVAALNPERGRRLRELFQRIVW